MPGYVPGLFFVADRCC